MNLSELEDGVSAEDQLLEILGYNKKENAKEVEAQFQFHPIYSTDYTTDLNDLPLVEVTF